MDSQKNKRSLGQFLTFSSTEEGVQAAENSNLEGYFPVQTSEDKSFMEKLERSEGARRRQRARLYDSAICTTFSAYKENYNPNVPRNIVQTNDFDEDYVQGSSCCGSNKHNSSLSSLVSTGTIIPHAVIKQQSNGCFLAAVANACNSIRDAEKLFQTSFIGEAQVVKSSDNWKYLNQYLDSFNINLAKVGFSSERMKDYIDRHSISEVNAFKARSNENPEALKAFIRIFRRSDFTFCVPNIVAFNWTTHPSMDLHCIFFDEKRSANRSFILIGKTVSNSKHRENVVRTITSELFNDSQKRGKHKIKPMGKEFAEWENMRNAFKEGLKIHSTKKYPPCAGSTHAICIKFNSQGVPILYDPGRNAPRRLFGTLEEFLNPTPEIIKKAVGELVISLIEVWQLYSCDIKF